MKDPIERQAQLDREALKDAKPERKMPCRECKRGCKDRWEAEE